jgi:hypothetical protein
MKYSFKWYKHSDSRMSTEPGRCRISSRVRKTLKVRADPLMGFAEVAHLYPWRCILSRFCHKIYSAKRHCGRSRWQCDISSRSAGIEVSKCVCGCGCLCLCGVGSVLCDELISRSEECYRARVCVCVRVCVGSVICDELISRSEESYRVCVRACVQKRERAPETSKVRQPWPDVDF